MLDRNNFGFDNTDSTYRYYDNTVYRLTDEGVNTIENYIQELKAKRKEILDAGKDTADETNIPTVSEIFCDAMDMEYECSGNSIIPSGEIVGNGWGVTDNYDADYPIGLEIGKDIEIVCRDTLKEQLTSVRPICYLNGKEYEINKQIILNYLDTWSGTGWTNEDKQTIADEVVFRMKDLEIDITAIQEFNFAEDAYTDAACCYIFSHNNSIQALLDEEDDLEIFNCMGMGKPQYEDDERDEI